MSEKTVIAKIILASVSFSFRPQVIDEDLTRVEGAEYQEHELDNSGNVVLENGEPKPIMARKKPAVRRVPVVAEIPYPTLAYFGIEVPYALDSNGFPVYESKELQALQNLIRERVESAARDTLENSATVDLSKVDWSVIAVKPKRSSSAVSKEDLESFIEVFGKTLAAMGKASAGIKFQSQLFKSRCRGVETYEEKVRVKVLENLAEVFTSLEASQQAEYSEVVEYLSNKINDANVPEAELSELL